MYTGVLIASSHIHCPGHLSTTPLCEGCVLGAASGHREGKKDPHSKDKVKSLQLPGSSSWIKQWSRLLNDHLKSTSTVVNHSKNCLVDKVVSPEVWVNNSGTAICIYSGVEKLNKQLR